MLRIGIDARLLSYRRGMGNYVYHLVNALAELPDRHEFILYVDNPAALRVVPDDSRFSARLLRPGLYPFWEQVRLPRQARRDRLDLLHCPANTAPLRLSGAVKLVITVHDVMYLLPDSVLPPSPSLYQRMGRRYRRWVVPRAAKRASSIATVSEYSRGDLIRLLEIDPARVSVSHEAPGVRVEGADPESAAALVEERFGLKGRFLVALGAEDLRKNTARVIEAFALYRSRSGDDCRLAIVGLSPGARKRFQELARGYNVEDGVEFLQFVTETELVALYGAAEMFLYPSLYEGFGLPVLEAMACGTPVIASDRASIPEIAGDAALLIDPEDTESLVSAIGRVAADPGLRQELAARGRAQASRFSWSEVARQALDLYQRTASAGRTARA